MVNVKVDVFGGISPSPIKVFIDNLNNADDHHYSNPVSFSQNFDLSPGRYMMTVTGVNPNNANAHTEMDVTGTFSVGPLYSNYRDVNTQL
ncbi:MAG: hypothetical protein ABWY22_11535, partial [Flavobacterium sp.]